MQDINLPARSQGDSKENVKMLRAHISHDAEERLVYVFVLCNTQDNLVNVTCFVLFIKTA